MKFRIWQGVAIMAAAFVLLVPAGASAEVPPYCPEGVLLKPYTLAPLTWSLGGVYPYSKWTLYHVHKADSSYCGAFGSFDAELIHEYTSRKTGVRYFITSNISIPIYETTGIVKFPSLIGLTDGVVEARLAAEAVSVAEESNELKEVLQSVEGPVIGLVGTSYFPDVHYFRESDFPFDLNITGEFPVRGVKRLYSVTDYAKWDSVSMTSPEYLMFASGPALQLALLTLPFMLSTYVIAAFVAVIILIRKRKRKNLDGDIRKERQKNV